MHPGDAQEEEYEWFKGYSEFAHLVTCHLQPASRILVLGCGNSSLTFDLFSAGFHHLTSVDLSPTVIERMRARAAAKVCPGVAKVLLWLTGMSFLVA